MELFVMLFLEVDVIHFMAGGTFFNVATTVAKVSSHFALWEFLKAVIAALHRFVLHMF